jgi:hypothetical protein
VIQVFALHGKTQYPDSFYVCSNSVTVPEAGVYVKRVILAEVVNMNSPHSFLTLQLGLTCKHIFQMFKPAHHHVPSPYGYEYRWEK